jgi:5,10-methylenetetrahydrofolate reductase
MNKNLIFEVMPYPKTASEAYAKKVTDKIVAALNQMENISTLNIPEIVEENHLGQPYYRNTDTRVFAGILKEKTGKDVIINTVAVHHKSKQAFEQWLDESINKYQIGNFIFVGAKILSLTYPGPSVTEANVIAKNKGVNFGNIFIPDRPEEADRLINKTESGCKFFTSQVLFEAGAVIDVIKGYLEKCRSKNLEPAKFYLSFTPIGTKEDLVFIKWLGTKIRDNAEKRLLGAKDIGQESIQMVLEIIEKIKAFSDESDIDISLNIEYVMMHNLELTKDLVNKIRKV